MDSSIESNIRTIHGKEYIVVYGGERTFYIQDFVRFPVIIHIDNPSEVPSGYVDRIKRNGSIGDVSGACGSFSDRVVITGSDSFSWIPESNQSCIGVHGAVFSDYATHAIVSDTDGYLLPHVRKKRSLPIGIFNIMSDVNLVAQWDRKSGAGIYKNPMSQHHCINQLAPGITTEIYAEDMAAGAVHFANTVLDCWDITLSYADLSFPDQRPGSVKTEDGRFIYPQYLWSLEYLAAVAHIILRNGGSVSYVRGTMVPIPGCEPIDNNIEVHTS